MNRILIISEYFAPINSIASIRATKLAKYLKLNNCYIGVVSRKLRANEQIDPLLQNDLEFVDEHLIVEESILARLISQLHRSKNNFTSINPSNTKPGLIKKIISRTFHLFMHDFKIYNNTLFFLINSYANRAAKHIEKLCINYDVVISSYGPFSCINLAYIAKCKNPEIFWIADFRDPLEIDWTLQKRRAFYSKLLDKVIQKANAITGVSDACIEEFNENFSGSKEVIYNGNDKDDIKDIKPVINTKFSFTYAGGLYTGKRDLGVVFKAINELANESKIDIKDIEVNYLGNDSLIFYTQAEVYNLSEICNILGKVTRERSLQVQLNSHILLLASWNSTGATGSITGKFLEYMMINKPIICTITGNLPNSQLKQMIEMADNGVVWEEANDVMDYPILKKYIHDQYQKYKKGLPLSFNPNNAYIEQFNYKNIAAKFINIIKEAK